MSLFKQIKKDQLAARKAKSKGKTALLTTLIGELVTDVTGTSLQPMDVTDEMVVAKVKKFTKSLQELAAVYPFQSDKQKAALTEIAILAEYLPKQLTNAELTKILMECGATQVGSAMAFLKTEYAGLYDGRAASTIAKSLF